MCINIKKPTYKELAEYLDVSEQAVKQYPKIKLDLMVQGLWRMKENGDKMINSNTNGVKLNNENLSLGVLIKVNVDADIDNILNNEVIPQLSGLNLGCKIIDFNGNLPADKKPNLTEIFDKNYANILIEKIGELLKFDEYRVEKAKTAIVFVNPSTSEDLEIIGKIFSINRALGGFGNKGLPFIIINSFDNRNMSNLDYLRIVSNIGYVCEIKDTKKIKHKK